MTARVAARCSWVALIVVVAAPSARAEPDARRTSTLAWVRLPGAEACIGPVELAAAVEARLGRVVFAPVSRADLAVEGRIEPTGLGFGATLVVSDRDGRRLGARELRSKERDCRAIDRALVLVTSLLIDPEAFRDAAPPPDAAPEAPLHPTPPPVQSSTEAFGRPPPPVPPPRAALWGVLGLSGGLGFGPLPSPGLGGALTLELGMQDGLRGQLSALLAHGVAETVAGTPAGFTLAAGAAAACFAGQPRPSLSWAACMGVELGGLLASAAALSGEQDRTGLWGAVVLGLHADLVLHREWLLHGALQAGLPLRRDRFTYVDGAGAERVLFEPGPVLVRLGLGLSFRFLGG